tara:strand:+ start:1 stop:795 length:795 start_codon:yes stop_codon:yes gene_type:complete
MESRRDQFQLLEHFTSAIKDDTARPQIAQLTELGLVELTRKRQGQNIYELFSKKCSSCDGTGHIENKLNFEIPNLKIKNFKETSDKSNGIQPIDLDTSQSTDKKEKTPEDEFLYSKKQNNEDSSNKKENNDLNALNLKEKNIITVDLTNDEKIVFSQLGINPLIKLGKEYLTNNNIVRLKDNSNEKEKILDNKKTKAKKTNPISKSKEAEEIEIEVNTNSEKKLIKKINKNEEVEFLNKEDALELNDETNNARKKRRRSSASAE